MTKSGLPKSVRKFIRLEKARIRAQFFDFKKQEELISEIYKKLLPVRNASPTSNASRSDAGWHSDAGGGQPVVPQKTKEEPKKEKPRTEVKKPARIATQSVAGGEKLVKAKKNEKKHHKT